MYNKKIDTKKAIFDWAVKIKDGVLIVAFCILVPFCMTGCSSLSKALEEANKEAEARREAEDANERFAVIEDGDYYAVVYDTDTYVMYAVSNWQYNRGTFTLLVDKDGNPLIYEGK